MEPVDQKLIAAMLILTLSFVIVIGIILVYFVLRSRYLRELAASPKEKNADASPELAEGGFRHPAFKSPVCWLAIKSSNLQSVQSAFALHNPQPCSWVEGLAGDGGQKLFVSPAISGWVLVIGPALPDPVDDVDVCFRFLLEISRKLGHVQFFHANGVLNHHAWAQAEGGRILRGYAWAGKTLWNQGAATPAEQDLKMKCYDYTEAAETPLFSAAEPVVSNSDKVHLLAARWSVDPEEIDERSIEKEWGIVGQPSRRL